MKLFLKNAAVCRNGEVSLLSVCTNNGELSFLPANAPAPFNAEVFDFSGCMIMPGFADVHVHLREPGFSYKETIESGTKAAARGGYTDICAMPNLNPVPDCKSALTTQYNIIRKSAVTRVYPYGSITVGEDGEELSNMDELASAVVAFSDDGKSVSQSDMMFFAMRKAASLNKIIAAHCESADVGAESEWRQIARDIGLAHDTKCPYHICHVSTKEGVFLVRQAKRDGINVTCETAPHYLLLDASDVRDSGRFRVNPPLRTEADRLALIKGVQDGTIDMIATDHAPHTPAEKSQGFLKSPPGFSGLETAFSVLYTGLVKTGIIPLTKLVELMSDNPKKRFSIGNRFDEGAPADFTVFDLEKQYTIDTSEFLSYGKCTPFEGRNVFGRCLMTVKDGEIIWKQTEK